MFGSETKIGLDNKSICELKIEKDSIKNITLVNSKLICRQLMRVDTIKNIQL